MNSVKVINVKNLLYYIFHAIINIDFRETTFQFKTGHVS